MRLVSVVMLCSFALFVPAASANEKPKPSADFEQLRGLWELRVKGGGIDYVLRLHFKEKDWVEFDLLCPKGDEEGLFGPAIFTSVSYALVERDGNRVIAIKDCSLFSAKAIDLPYEFKDGKLVIRAARATLSESESLGDFQISKVNFSGTWTRKKVP